MKNKFYLGLIAISFNSIAQQGPTGSGTGVIPATPNNMTKAWFRGGNNFAGAGANDNIFGTKWNSPIYTQTAGQTRTRLNGNLIALIFGVNQNVSGFFGIDPNGFFDNNSPKSLLHLHTSNAPAFTTGWRRWMKTGMFVEENTDGMYVGLKTEATSNRSDAVINWSDDGTNAGGVDKLRFIFTGSTPTGNGIGTSPSDGNSLNGYEFMRMQTIPFANNSAGFPIGHIGIGPMFTNVLPPANRLHVNAEDNLGTFIEVSNSTGTGQTGNDGLHFGYPTTSPTFLTAHINQKENDNLVMLTNQGERLRVSHIGNVSIANMNPGAIANDITRVSISHNPANPVTRPLSLLHLGYNTGSLLNPNNTDGWRPWMDVGMFVAQSSDNVYLGLKNESTTPLGDKYDAVLSWGDNQVNSGLPPNNGPDNFRFIFTSSTTGSADGTAPATGADGLEGMRLTPTTANGVYTGIGGAPTVNPYTSGLNAGNTAEINSWGATSNPGGSSGLRFTNLNTTSPTLANPGLGVLSVDANGDVIYVKDICKTTLVLTSPSSSCPTGGVTVQYGVDVNCNGVLDPSEINNTLTQNICNGAVGNTGAAGAAGTNGLNTLANSTTVGNGFGGCATGGIKIETGVDLNNDNILQANEITQTQYVCNGATGNTGAPGVAGTNGLNTLANSTTVGNGVGGCTTGGIKIETGVDLNNDNILQANEITQTQYVCNGLPGPTGPAGGIVNAQNGLSLLNPSTVEFGNAVGGTSATLLNDRQVPMNDKTILFNGLGSVKVGLFAAVTPLGAPIVPTFEVNNSNSPNNVGLYINDQGGNSRVNRQGLLIRMNLNNGDQNTTALDLVHSNPASNQTSSSFLIKAKGTDYLTNGVVEKFLLDVTGYAGFNAPSTSYRRAATVIESFGRLGQEGNPYYSDVNPGGTVGYNKALMVNNVINFSEHAVGIQTYCRGESHSATGIIAVGEALGTVNLRTGIGVKATGISNATNAYAYGVFADAYPGTLNSAAPTIGVYGEAKNSTTSNYGIYGKAAVSTAAPINYAGYFVGDVNIIGNLTLPTGVGSISSDANLKTNIDSLQNALSIIKQLKPKTFNYDTTRYFLKSNSAKNYGLIAQDVEQILPELINEYKMEDLKDSTGNVIATGGNYKGLNYNAFIPILIKGLQEQQFKIDSLKHAVDSLTTKVNTKDSIQDARLAALEAAIDKCCTNANAKISNNSTQTAINQLDVELSDKDAIVLNQNVPNPFAEQTTITYNVPVSIAKAQIIFYNSAGQIIQTVDVKTRGKGKVNVFASDLSSGLYHYTLVADGKVVDSKKMVRE
jgi:hypothetical protein